MTPTPAGRRLIAAGCLAACLLVGAAAERTASASGAENGPQQLAYGLRFLKAKDYPRAIVHLTAAIETRALEPKRLSDAHYFRGRALTRTRRPGLALEDFSRALLYWPENVKALRVRCRALTLQGALDDAERDCDQAVLLAPEDWRGWFTRGLLRDEKSEPILARGDFSAAQMRMPDGLESFPGIARPLREYGLLEGSTAPVTGTGPHPSWQED